MNFLANLLSTGKIKTNGGALDFTMNAGVSLQSLVHKEDFSNRDSELIFKYLREHAEYVPFGLYLRRYIYRRMDMSADFKSVSDNTYYEIIKNCFIRTKTPYSFHKTSTTIKVLINGWLKASTVNRENVFLLGFALKMSVEDVSLFLTRAICDYDFNFNNPEEVIYWHCYRNNFPASHALKMIDKYNATDVNSLGVDYDRLSYEDISSSFLTRHQISWDGEMTIPVIDRNLIGHTDQDIIDYLLTLRLRNRKYKYSLTAYTQFCRILDEAKEEIKRERDEEQFMEAEYIALKEKTANKEVRSADIEKALYSAVPLVSGNLKNITYSVLGKSFARHRLTRQRISRLLSGKAAVSRFDLITINFLLVAKKEQTNPILRYKNYVATTDDVLKKCFMGPLNLSNLYEAFILACLLTEDPICSFSDVWEMAYDDPGNI